jgi:hypothetical protein
MSNLFNTLSTEQKNIILFLGNNSSKSQLECNRLLYEEIYGGDSNAARASLSRTYRRMEDRGLIQKVLRKWVLTEGLSGFGSFKEGAPQSGAMAHFLILLEVVEWEKKQKVDEAVNN